MKFKHHPLRNEINVRSLVTCFYFEFSKTFSNKGEKHNFWEIVYVDKGEAKARTKTGVHLLKQGDLVFHEPNEFHNLSSSGDTAPNIFIITFVCTSDPMIFFAKNKKFRLGEFERTIFTQLMREGLHLIDLKTKPSSLSKSERESHFACEQLVSNYLETLLIHLLRHHHRNEERPILSSTRKNQANLLTDQIIAFLETNLAGKWTLQQVCEKFGIGRTQINIIFKERTGCGVIEYMNQLRVEKAKEYIRIEVYNLTEISDLLGYSSIHYFSRHFKKTTGMTPSEYARSINLRGWEVSVLKKTGLD